ncbi:hypothetical protein, partial [Parvularcula maris]
AQTTNESVRAQNALGVGLESLFLKRQAEALNKATIAWYDFFDKLTTADVPRASVKLYLRLKTSLLGETLSLRFFLVTFSGSLFLTVIAVTGGRALGFHLLDWCNASLE